MLYKVELTSTSLFYICLAYVPLPIVVCFIFYFVSCTSNWMIIVYCFLLSLTDSSCSGFRCNNYQCVASSDRCDGTQDCTDGSDESNCFGKLVITEPHTYSFQTNLKSPVNQAIIKRTYTFSRYILCIVHTT